MQIDRVVSLSRRDFEERYLLPGKPVLIEGQLAHFKAYREWTGEYLNRALRDVPLRVTTSEAGRFNHSPNRVMSADEFFADRPHAPGGDPYMARVVDESLRPDVEYPDYFDPRDHLMGPVLWCGRRSLTALHYHPHGEAMLCVLRGEKRCLLYDPTQTPLLYPRPFYDPDFHASLVADPEEKRQGRFPRFAEAQPMECVVRRGDILYIPVHYWHAVYGSDELSIALTYFWRSRFSAMLVPPAGKLHHWASLLYQRNHVLWRDVVTFALRRGPRLEVRS